MRYLLLVPVLFLAWPVRPAAPAGGWAAGEPRGRPSAGVQAGSGAPQNVEKLASSGRPYLVLDLQANRLVLYQGAALLREFQFKPVRLGTRRFAALFGVRSRTAFGVWEPRSVAPRRRQEHIELRSDRPVNPDPSALVTWIPPLPDSLNPTPRRFFVRYAGGFSLEVIATGAGPASGRSAPGGPGPFFSWNPDRVRLRIIMPEPDAGALYRSSAIDVPLVVVVPDLDGAVGGPSSLRSPH